MKNKKVVKNKAGVSKLSDPFPIMVETKKLPTYEEALLELDTEIEDLKSKGKSSSMN